MHIGVVTSSLGPRLGDVCTSTTPVVSVTGVTAPPYNNDNGHLINRTGPFGAGAALSEAALPEGGGFLSWFPSLGNAGTSPVTPPAAITTIGAAGQANTIVGDLTSLIAGAGSRVAASSRRSRAGTASSSSPTRTQR